MANWLDKYEQGGLVLKKKTKDNFGKKANPNDVQASVGPDFVGLGYNTKGRNYSPAWGGQFQMGGALPGAVGFTYARTAGSAPANGKYTKKTKASAQNGKEMAFYQNGLDFKPKTISKNGSVIKDDRGQWAHPGEITEIGSNDITMQGVDYPVLGVSDTGDEQMMYPGEDYKFDGEKVTEFPMAQNGDWLSKYATEQMRQDATRVAPPVLKLTDKEKLANAAKSDQAQKRALSTAKEVIAERKKNKATKGDLNTPGSWHTEDKARLFPNSPGGLGEVIDEYINPATYVGVLADALGESVTARDPKAVALSLGLAAGAGALGFDPLGSALKVPRKVAQSMESGLLSNAYKLNPLAFKPDPEAYYRMLGTGEDVLESGLIRPNPNNIAPDGVQRFAVSHFSKGRPWNTRELGTAGYKGPYMAELSNYPMEGFTAAGWPKESLGHVPVDIPNVKLYKENWLKGYKEVPKLTSTSRRLTNKEIQEYNQKLYLDRRKGLGNQGSTDAPPEGLMPFESPEYKQGGWLNKYK